MREWLLINVMFAQDIVFLPCDFLHYSNLDTSVLNLHDALLLLLLFIYLNILYILVVKVLG